LDLGPTVNEKKTKMTLVAYSIGK